MHQALIIYIIFQSLLFSIALVSRQKPENKPLVFYFVYLFLFYTFFMLSNDGFWINYSENELIRMAYDFIALCKSAVVFYFLYSILEKPMPRQLNWLWLLPLLHVGTDYAFKTLDPAFYNAGFYLNWYLSFPFYVKILFVALLIWQVKVFNKEIRENGSSKKHHELIKLYWGKYFIYFYLALTSFSLLYLLFTLTNGRLYTIGLSSFIYSAYDYDMIHHGFTAFFLLVFGYLALRNPSVFNASSALTGPHLEQQIAEIVLPEEEKKFQTKTEFTAEQISQYGQVLTKLIEIDKVYLDPELSLSKLSKLSSIPSRQLSQFIQITFQKNYKEYINSYRVLHARQLLTRENASRDTMYGIAFDSGFNSESSFYKVFKQQTGLTPKQYQDRSRA